MKFPQENEEESAAEHHHHRLVEEIAQRVQEKIVSRFAVWMLINAGALIAALAGGLAAFYQQDRDVKVLANANSAQDLRIQLLEAHKAADHSMLEGKIDRLASSLDEVNRYLRDHNNGAGHK